MHPRFRLQMVGARGYGVLTCSGVSMVSMERRQREDSVEETLVSDVKREFRNGIPPYTCRGRIRRKGVRSSGNIVVQQLEIQHIK